jgi:hypothetical protein
MISLQQFKGGTFQTDGTTSLHMNVTCITCLGKIPA